jgi:hypothetical protein
VDLDGQLKLINQLTPQNKVISDTIFAGDDNRTVLIAHGIKGAKITAWNYRSTVENDNQSTLLNDFSSSTIRRLARRPSPAVTPRQLLTLSDGERYRIWSLESGRLVRQKSPLRIPPSLKLLENEAFVKELQNSVAQLGLRLVVRVSSVNFYCAYNE